MNDKKENLRVADGIVVDLDYTLKVDDEVVDSSEDGEPIKFIQGQGHIIKGLERELYGMEVGDHRDIMVSPQDGYGDVDRKAKADVPKGDFPGEIPLKPGTELQVRDKNGKTMNARIESVGEEKVRLDFNHPLAGKELHFSVQVNDLRPATQAEMDHGHVHAPGSHGH
ncbi:MAG TPA: peptidylprolyl isomerase [Anaerolineales bacterium]|nr:peptidylprolyl isomerase [Anaerolineales bacterium]